MDERKRDEGEAKSEPVDRESAPLFLDMGLGSREQGFKAQKPDLKLVHSR